LAYCIDLDRAGCRKGQVRVDAAVPSFVGDLMFAELAKLGRRKPGINYSVDLYQHVNGRALIDARVPIAVGNAVVTALAGVGGGYVNGKPA
jgi:hypothetical protein